MERNETPSETRNAVLKRLSNGETAASISAETGILAGTIRGWAFKEKARLEVENATKRLFPAQNAETGRNGFDFFATPATQNGNERNVSATRATQTIRTETMPVFQPDFILEKNATGRPDETDETPDETELHETRNAGTFFRNILNDYIGDEILLAFISLSGIAFSLYTWNHTLHYFGLCAASIGGLWILHAMKVSRDPAAWYSSDMALVMAFIVEAATGVFDYLFLESLAPEGVKVLFAAGFTALIFAMKFGGLVQTKNRTQVKNS